MDITNITTPLPSVPKQDEVQSSEKENIAAEFEQIFAKQLVEQMAKDLFKGSETGMMKNSLYKDHIIDTLSAELAKQEPLGISKMIREYWQQKTDENVDEPTR
ncbi:MAG: hypothetical protein WEA56_08895 [Balneolaceae bacterium]